MSSVKYFVQLFYMMFNIYGISLKFTNCFGESSPSLLTPSYSIREFKCGREIFKEESAWTGTDYGYSRKLHQNAVVNIK